MWQPGQYLKFEQERTQPVRDLVVRVGLASPQEIIDIGCGPGNSTAVLKQRWPEANILGIDSSEAMVEEARERYPAWQWECIDARSLPTRSNYDLVFSNATLQWVPDHEKVIPRLLQMVRPGGVLAVQVPANQASPLYRAIVGVAASPPWHTYMVDCSLPEYHEARFYAALFTQVGIPFQLWETIYYHSLQTHEALIEWVRGTSLLPYLTKLPDHHLKEAFEREILSACQEDYPHEPDGSILYPFKRLFLVASLPDTSQIPQGPV